MRSSFSALGLSVMFIISATGRQRPNFSGTWEQTSSHYREFIEKIVHQGPNLTIETTIREKPGPPTTLQRPMASLHIWPAPHTPRGRKEGYRVTVPREMYTLSDDSDPLTRFRRNSASSKMRYRGWLR